MCTGLHTKYPLYSFHFNENFINRYSRSTQIPHFMKIRPVGTKLFHADRQTDRYGEANSRLSQFCKKRLQICFMCSSFLLGKGLTSHPKKQIEWIWWNCVVDNAWPQQTANKKLRKSYNNKVHRKYETLRQPVMLWATQSPLITQHPKRWTHLLLSNTLNLQIRH
jgi:hypothetical protein